MRLFFSWQSDIPSNKNLIRKSLQRVCEELDIEYTEDTRGEAGGDHVVDVLLRKISNSQIFVADITIVGKAVNGDELSNSNVSYELGYAEAKLGRKNLIMIMNEEHGSYDKMPFDLGKRMITRFKTTDNKLTPAEQKELTKQLRIKIESLTAQSEVVLKEDLNIYERTILYWIHQSSDDYLHIGLMSTPEFSLGELALEIGDSFHESGIFFHKMHDHKEDALFKKAVNSLVSKGLLIPTQGMGDDTWAITPEGEVSAAAITDTEVKPQFYSRDL